MFKIAAIHSLTFVYLLGLLGCADGGDNASFDPGSFSYDEMGPYPVGNQTVSIMNTVHGRALNVEIWYPAVSVKKTQTIEDFALDEMEREDIATLLTEVPEQCTRRETSSGDAPKVASRVGKLPLVVFSHCHNCTRYSAFSLAERLASHGIAVAAPDHPMNTLFDSGALINGEFLAVRATDIIAVLDELLTQNSAALPPFLQDRFDAARIGVAGHSYGAATAGKVLQDDARFKAGLIIAAPVESPVLPGVTVAGIEEPMLFMIAQEDNSIGVLGNAVLRANYTAAASPAWKVEIADAGHWSFTDIAGIIPGFSAGCGDGERQTVPGEIFTYIDNTLARDITAGYGMRFFAAQLLGDQVAAAELAVSSVPGIVDVMAK